MKTATKVSERIQKRHESTALHSLVSVAARLGIDISFTELSRRFHLDTDEPATEMLVAIAREIGLDAQIVNLKFAELPRLAKMLPAVIRLRDGGSLVLEEARIDPAAGVLAILHDASTPGNAIVALNEMQLSELWAGEVVLIKRRYLRTSEQQPFSFAWIIGQVLREKKLIRNIGAAAVISTAFALAPPFIFRVIIDRVLVNNSFSTLNVIVGAILLMIVFEAILTHLRRGLAQVMTTRVDGRINLFVMDRLMNLPMDYFEHNSTGKIMSKIFNIWQIRTFVTVQLLGSFLDLVPLLGLIPVMLYLQWELSLFVFALAGIVSLIVLVFLPLIGRKHRLVVLAEQAKGSYLTESIYGMRAIKSLSIEGRRRREWDVLVARAAEARHNLGVVSNYPQTFSLPFERLIYSGSFALGAYVILSNPSVIDPGSLVAFAMLSMRLAAPLINIARLQQDWAEARGAILEVASIVNSPPERTREGTGMRKKVEGEIVFKDVRFRYSPDSSYALDGVSFTVPAGKMLGIMGRSGSGKTTVTRLLQALHTGYEGTIKVDGVDLREIDLTHLRTSFGVVPQENFLFSGSIRENIGMARPDATLEQIVRAAQLAGAEEFIERMPRSYETRLEEGAVNLSGGQRQRLAIARALVVDPPVLVLDEATSALDAESEAIVNANLRRIGKGRTVLCISHRLSMLVEADAILVLEKGKVYDIGTHEELLERCDIYKQLWFEQNRHAGNGASATPLALTRSVN